MGRRTPAATQESRDASAAAAASSQPPSSASSQAACAARPAEQPRLVPVGRENEPEAGLVLPAVLGRGAATGVHDPRCSRNQARVTLHESEARTARVAVSGVNASLIVRGRTGARVMVKKGAEEDMVPGDVLELLPGVQPSFRLVWPLPPLPPSSPQGLCSSDNTNTQQTAEATTTTAATEASTQRQTPAETGAATETPQEPHYDVPAAAAASDGSFQLASGHVEDEAEAGGAEASMSVSCLPFATVAVRVNVLCLPLLGTGVLGMDTREAAAIASAAIGEFLAAWKSPNMRVVLTASSTEEQEALAAGLGDVARADTRLAVVDTPLATLFSSYVRKTAALADAPLSERDGQPRVFHAVDASWRWKLVNAPAVAQQRCCAPAAQDDFGAADATVEEALRRLLGARTGQLSEVRGVELPLAPRGAVSVPLLLCVAPNSRNAAKPDLVADPVVARAALAQTYQNLCDVFRRIVTLTDSGARVLLS